MKIKAGLEADYTEYKRINADGGYSERVVSYGEDWVKLMEEYIAAAPNEPVANTILLCAKETSHQADTDGITGFMYGAAVSGLAKFWEHGELLRRWHNNDLAPMQAEEANAKGVTLNPALMTIRVRDDE
jgi:hypothetical protein